ncbi:hypothetical protein Ahu01nite_076000 [Winogradskya humida]|uniref:Uncharacterized protein n=1 Tax=Winogradskya humida TaxID=113566 RepID=A0ABQ4A102_9ACTN|nr:hypothetical protein Ahu01nite_076000 [Actinoplanes humidus]
MSIAAYTPRRTVTRCRTPCGAGRRDPAEASIGAVWAADSPDQSVPYGPGSTIVTFGPSGASSADSASLSPSSAHVPVRLGQISQVFRVSCRRRDPVAAFEGGLAQTRPKPRDAPVMNHVGPSGGNRQPAPWRG